MQQRKWNLRMLVCLVVRFLEELLEVKFARLVVVVPSDRHLDDRQVAENPRLDVDVILEILQ